MLKRFFTQADCAKCRFCCVFSPDDAWESPFVPEEEAFKLTTRGIPMEKRSIGGWSFRLEFQDQLSQCPMLNPQTGCTMTPNEKPFECSIWPIRLMNDGKGLCIGRHRECPALTPEITSRLDHFVTGEFLPVLLEYAKRYPESLRPLSLDYIIIWREANQTPMTHRSNDEDIS